MAHCEHSDLTEKPGVVLGRQLCAQEWVIKMARAQPGLWGALSEAGGSRSCREKPRREGSGQRAKAEWRHQHTRRRKTWRVSVVGSRAREARPSCQVHGQRTGKVVGAGFGSGTVAVVGSSGLSRKMLSMVTDPLC